MLHEVHDSAVVLIGLGLLAALSLVAKRDLESFVQERHDLEALEDGLGAEISLFKNRGVWPERNRRSRSVSRGLARYF